MNESLSRVNTIGTIIRLNKLHQYEGYTGNFDSTTYNKFINLGYVVNVFIPTTDNVIDYDKFFSKWNIVTLDNNNLYMLIKE